MIKDRLGKGGHGNPKAFTALMIVGVNRTHARARACVCVCVCVDG